MASRYDSPSSRSTPQKEPLLQIEYVNDCLRAFNRGISDYLRPRSVTKMASSFMEKLVAMSEEGRIQGIRCQVTSFIEKLDLCEQSYSLELAQNMLHQIQVQEKLSVDTLRKLKKVAQKNSENKTQPQHILYAQWYIENLQYLNSIRANFETRIYYLLKNFYSDIGEQKLESDGVVTFNNRPSSKQRSASVLSFKDELPEICDLYDYSDVDNIISRLDLIRMRWRMLLEEDDEINSALFSLNSKHFNQTNVSSSTKLVPILRLVPDILHKSRKAALLATQWLDLASQKLLSSDAKLLKLDRVQTVLSGKLETLTDTIDSSEKELETVSEGLEQLLDREERSNMLMASVHDIDTQIQAVEAKLAFVRQELTVMDQSKEEDYRVKKLMILTLEKQLTSHLFTKKLVSEDLTVELEVKPCIIRFTNHLQDKCEKLEQLIDQKQCEKFRVESALVPVKQDLTKTQAKVSRSSSQSSNLT